MRDLPGTLRRVKLPWMLVIAALAITGCDPTWAATVDNQSDQTILVGRIYRVDGEPGRDVLVAGPHARTTIGTYGVGARALVEHVVLMTESCEVLASQPIWDTFYEGGVILVGPDQSIGFNGGGNPPSGEAADATPHCLDTVRALAPQIR